MSNSYLKESSQSVFFGENSEFFIKLKEDYFRSNYWNLMQNLVKSLGFLRILEIGPGFGEVASLIHRELRIDSYTALDIDPDIVNHIKSKGFEANLCESIHEYLHENKLIYNVVLMLDVLEHIPRLEAEKTIRIIYDQLQSGGLILIQVPNMSAPFAENIAFSDVTHCHLLNEHSMRQFLLGCNINYFEIRPFKLPNRWLRKIQGVIRGCVYKLCIFMQRLTGIMPCSILTPNLVVVVRK